MLRLKDEVDVNNKLSIFVHKSRGRKLVFDPQTVHPSEYPKYKLMGFNIFRCTNCGFDTCFGDCTLEYVEDDYVDWNEDVEIFEMDDIDEYLSHISETEEITTETINNDEVIQDIIKNEKVSVIEENPPKKKRGRPKKEK